MIGLSNGANKASASISDIGNLWIWAKKEYTVFSPATYVLGEKDTSGKSLIYNYSDSQLNSSRYVRFQYSTSVSVASDGTVSLVNPSIAKVYKTSRTAGTGYTVLQGKFFKFYDKYPTSDTTLSCDFEDGGIYFCPSDAYFTTSSTYTIKVNHTQLVTGIAERSGYVTVEYKTDSNPTAYPENGQIGDYLYTLLGQIGDGISIEHRSYVGTGLYGIDNPTVIELTDTAKIIIFTTIYGRISFSQSGSTEYPLLAYIPLLPDSYVGSSFLVPTAYSGSGETFTKCINNKLYIYNSVTPNTQFNTINYVYNYILIG